MKIQYKWTKVNLFTGLFLLVSVFLDRDHQEAVGIQRQVGPRWQLPLLSDLLWASTLQTMHRRFLVESSEPFCTRSLVPPWCLDRRMEALEAGPGTRGSHLVTALPASAVSWTHGPQGTQRRGPHSASMNQASSMRWGVCWAGGS